MAEEFTLDGARPEPHLGNSGEFFGALIDHLTEKLTNQGMTAEKASQLVCEIVVELSETFAGEHLYVGKRPKVFAKWLQMYTDLSHMDHKDVDKKYRVSQGYSLKVRQKIREKRQHRQQLRLDI